MVQATSLIVIAAALLAIVGMLAAMLRRRWPATGPAGPQGPTGPAGPPGASADMQRPASWYEIALARAELSVRRLP